MTLTNRQILDVVILAYYAVALPLSLWLVVKHGFARQQGWFYLVLLSLLRLIGAGTGYAYINNPTSNSLLEASVICDSIGISPLLLTLCGILDRVNNGMNGYGVNKNFGRMIHIPVIIGLILAIVAGTKEFSSKPSDVTTGQHLEEGAVILFIIAWVALVAMAVIIFSRKQSIIPGESKLLAAGFLSLPFIFVRILYTVVVAYDHTSTTFNIESTTDAGVIVQAIMESLMEFIAVAIFIAIALIAPKVSGFMARKDRAAPEYVNPKA